MEFFERLSPARNADGRELSSSFRLCVKLSATISTNPRQGRATWFVQDAQRSELAADQDLGRGFLRYFTDDGGVGAERVFPQTGQGPLRSAGADQRQQFSFVRHMQWIQPQELTGASNHFRDW
jgi:hypothetical protein